MIGKTISHYKILEKLGFGAMGEVYKAYDSRLDRIVALKFLKESLLHDKKAKARFDREAKILSALTHPNITIIYYLEEVRGSYFISMEYVQGRTLGRIINKKPLTLDEFFDISIQIARGLSAAHERGIVHRDVKPDNIMITYDDQVKITDFGIAKLQRAPRLTAEDVPLGTFDYMSPEQVQRLPVDNRSDIFSLGVVMYEMLTGHIPFKGNSIPELTRSISRDLPEPLWVYRSDIPEQLWSVIRRALEKNAHGRYQKVSELITDLENAREKPEPHQPTLAVFPFENLGGGKKEDYIVDAITEEIITRLGRIRGLRVLPKSDVLPYKGKQIVYRQVGRELGVEYALMGSVVKAADRLRINVQLIETGSGRLADGWTINGNMSDVFSLQINVAREIAKRLRIKISRRVLTKLRTKPTRSYQAWDYYSQAREYYWRLSRDDIKFSIEMYQRALKLDNEYALAYAGLADAHVYQYEAWFDRSSRVLEDAERESKKAIELDPELAEAHRSLGRVFMFKGKINAAIRELKKAIELGTNFVEAYRALGWIYEDERRYEEAMMWVRKALDLRDTDRESLLLKGLIYYDQRLFDFALSAFNEALELHPDYSRARYFIASTLVKQGKLDEAIEEFKECIKTGGEQNAWIDLGSIFLLKKEHEKALKFYKESISRDNFDFLAFYLSGLTYRDLKRERKARSCFEKAVHLCLAKIEKDKDNAHLHSTLALAYLSLGEEKKGKREISVLGSSVKENGPVAYNVARFHALRNDEKSAARYLKIAFKLPWGPSKCEIRLDPHFKSLKKSSLFLKLVRD